MKEKGLSLQGAMDYAGNYFNGLFKTYITERSKVAKWGPQAELYINSLGYWVSGSIAVSIFIIIHLFFQANDSKRKRSGALRRRGISARSMMKSRRRGRSSCSRLRERVPLKRSSRVLSRFRLDLFGSEVDRCLEGHLIEHCTDICMHFPFCLSCM
jgi:hypothetical protein